jgi:outer membrane autotransporter protein
LIDAVAKAVDKGGVAATNKIGHQLNPNHSSIAATAGAMPTFSVLQLIAARSDNLRFAAAHGTGVATGEGTYTTGAWGQVFGGHADQSAVNGMNGYRANYGGTLLGADTAVSDTWRLGGVFSYSNTLIQHTGDTAGNSTRVNGYGLMGYASLAGNPWYLNLSAGYVMQNYSTHRQIDIISQTARGSFSGNQYVLSAEGGWPMAVSGMTLTPLAGVAYSYQRQDRYTESGSIAALMLGNVNTTSIRSSLGAKLEKGYETAYGTVVPYLQAKWVHEYDKSTATTDARFAASPTDTGFTTVGATPVRNIADITVGINILKANDLTLTAQYGIQAGSGFLSQTGALRVRKAF